MKKTAAEVIVDILIKNNIDTVFGYPGAASTPLHQALSKSNIRHILPRSEQSAAHEATGYSRVNGGVGVCIATSGPGATNLLTGIANAYMDSLPLIAITGQVTSEQIGRDVFQEVDMFGTTAPYCKHSYLVKDATQIPRIFHEAFYIASTGRPGPVVVDIPMDLQLQEIEVPQIDKVDIRGYKPTVKGHEMQIKRAVEEIKQAKRPVFLAGHGILLSGAVEEFRKIVEISKVPTISTLLGIGVLPTEHPLNFGMIGSHGMVQANFALQQADLIFIIGSRISDRAVPAPSTLNDKRIVHIDVDPAEIGKIVSTNTPIVGDIKDVLTQMLGILEENEPYTEWCAEIVARKKPIRIPQTNGTICAKNALHLLSNMVDEDAIVTTEVGQNQIWAARNWNFKEQSKWITSGGFGTMGYGLPAAVGAKLAAPDRQVIAVEGDGSFQMSMGELATIVANALDIKIILLCNSELGMVNEYQRVRNYNNYAVHLAGNPDFSILASAYGIEAAVVNNYEDLEHAYEKMLAWDGPYLLQINIDAMENTL